MTTTNWISSSFYGTFLKLPWRRNFWSRKQIAKVYVYKLSFPGSSHSKDSAYNSGDMDSILGYRRSPGEGNGNPLQYSCLRIPWTEEPGGLQSMGSRKVRHNWAANTLCPPKLFCEVKLMYHYFVLQEYFTLLSQELFNINLMLRRNFLWSLMFFVLFVYLHFSYHAYILDVFISIAM